MFWFTEPSIPPLQYPHPVITEVLYAVPTSDGDANRDGTRDSAGDEFIELVNPHARPIDLRGYTISDSGEGKARFKFTFPAVLLEPGQVVVVFNGSDAKLTGPVGDSKMAPVEGHPKFHNALVFTARAQSSRSSWANKSDYALLLAPGGTPLQCIHWGGEKKPPTNCLVVEEAPTVSRGSVQRAMPTPEEESPALKPIADPPPRKPASTTPAKPASDAAPKKRQRYVPDREEPPAPQKPAGQPLTFHDFIAHPPVPARIILGTSTNPASADPNLNPNPNPDMADQDDLGGILFSPGLYPLPPARAEGSTDEAGTRDADTRAARPASSARDRSKDPPRTNVGDPR
jgi:hypothetical protein